MRRLTILDADGVPVTHVSVQLPPGADPRFVDEVASRIRQSLRAGYRLDYPDGAASTGASTAGIFPGVTEEERATWNG